MIPWYRPDVWLCWWLTHRVDMESAWMRRAIVEGHRAYQERMR